jgi:hypothetical protein
LLRHIYKGAANANASRHTAHFSSNRSDACAGLVDGSRVKHKSVRAASALQWRLNVASAVAPLK